MRVLTIFGTRPEIIKLSPVIPPIDEKFDHILVHTGQHYDYELDKIFFEQLNLRNPDHFLDVGHDEPINQISKMLSLLSTILSKTKPDLIIVQGDTNSALGGAIAAKKVGARLAHVEAGCRSYNLNMPEEINRRIVDHSSDLLFAPDNESIRNLEKEGIYGDSVHLVGCTGIEACMNNAKSIKKAQILSELGLADREYALATIHRAENTEPEQITDICKTLIKLSDRLPIVFPVHPRSRKIIERIKIPGLDKIKFIQPVGYFDFLSLMNEALIVLTDSGGVQVESAVLGTPCLILRKETEWSELVNIGKNFIVGNSINDMAHNINSLLDGRLLEKSRNIPWAPEGKPSAKITSVLKETSDHIV